MVLIRVTFFIIDFNKKVILNSFIKRQFNYCPLPWMFSARAVNHKINRHLERIFRALLNDEISAFNGMLWKSNDTTIHVKKYSWLNCWCVKNVHIRSFSGLYFPTYIVYLHIQSKCRKIRTRKSPNTDTFHAVGILQISLQSFRSHNEWSF